MIKLSDSMINLQLISYIVVKDNVFPIKLGAIQKHLFSLFLFNKWY